MNDHVQTIQFEFIPEAGVENKLDTHWQQECKALQKNLAKKLENLGETELAAVSRSSEPGAEGDADRSMVGLFDFASLILSLKSPEVIQRAGGILWDSLNTWFNRRSECSAVIRVGDSEFNFKNLTKEDLIELMQRQQSAVS